MQDERQCVSGVKHKKDTSCAKTAPKPRPWRDSYLDLALANKEERPRNDFDQELRRNVSDFLDGIWQRASDLANREENNFVSFVSLLHGQSGKMQWERKRDLGTPVCGYWRLASKAGQDTRVACQAFRFRRPSRAVFPPQIFPEARLSNKRLPETTSNLQIARDGRGNDDTS